jgi:hypothetical protein
MYDLSTPMMGFAALAGKPAASSAWAAPAVTIKITATVSSHERLDMTISFPPTRIFTAEPF